MSMQLSKLIETLGYEDDYLDIEAATRFYVESQVDEYSE